MEFVPAPAHQAPTHLQQKKQRVNSARQKESQAVPKVDLPDDLASTENEVGLAIFHKQPFTFDHLIPKVFLTPEEEVVPAIGDPTRPSRSPVETKSKVPAPVSATFSQVFPLSCFHPAYNWKSD